jgi:AraC-like DNA-binding protein
MSFSTEDVFRILGLVQGLGVGLALIFFKRKNVSLLFLGIFLIAFTAPSLSWLIRNAGGLELYPRLLFLPIGFYFLVAPLLYIYVKSLGTKFSRKLLLAHLTLGLIEFGFLFVLFLLPPKLARTWWSSINEIIDFVYGVFLNIYSLVYLISTIVIVKKFKRKSLNFYSNTQKRLLRWILFTTSILIIVYLYQLSTAYFVINDISRNTILLVDSLLAVIFIYWVSIAGIRQTTLGFASLEVADEDNSESEKSDVTFAEYEKFTEEIRHDKIFANPDLTIADLAAQLKTPAKRLSKMINQYGKVNFNRFINELRVEEAKNLLVNPKNDHLTIEGIGYQAGFKSKTVFNTFFKSTVGITPSVYKKNHRSIPS